MQQEVKSPKDMNVQNRRSLLMTLRSEVVGPDPRGKRLDSLPNSLTKEAGREEYAVVCQQNDEEILTKESPTRRYGAGVLFPRKTGEQTTDIDASDAGILHTEEDDPDAKSEESKSPHIPRTRTFDADTDDVGVTATNGFKPSAMGLSLVVDLEKLGDGDLRISVASRFRTGTDSFEQKDCGFYREHNITETSSKDGANQHHQRTWWCRVPFHADSKAPEVLLDRGKLEAGFGKHMLEGIPGFSGRIALRWHVRRWPGCGEHQRLVTLTLVNESTSGEGAVDALCLFQSGLVVAAPPGSMDDYPRAVLPAGETGDALADEKVNRVIYRKRTVRAVGHGCAVDWDDTGALLWTDVMPAWEMPPMAFDITDTNGHPMRLPMRSFTEMTGKDSDAFNLLENLVSGYEEWIDQLATDDVPAESQETANKLMHRCREAAERMRSGLEYLKGNDSRPEHVNALKAFALANRAMLMAQHRRSGEVREPQFEGGTASPTRSGDRAARNAPATLTGWNRTYDALALDNEKIRAAEDRTDNPVGHWRPFQLAFLLMSVEGILFDKDCDDREIVDLIWFPTGGGKTEAYLGLTAFTVFYNVLSGRTARGRGQPRGVSVLMRYTLRLLTAQQFERAVKLFCAMELIRKRDEAALGDSPFTVGLWVGSDNTPNKVNGSKEYPGAVQYKKELEEKKDARNPFVLLQCPWCSARFGRVANDTVLGYQITGKGVNSDFRYVCPDDRCEFGRGRNLPIPAQVVDDLLYKEPPTLLIGTVDKFAMLAWKPEVRSFFGIDTDGSRAAPGPTLIIQDEMHLMTGPLGTMVGLFETAVDALCRHDGGKVPKIIASTATAAHAPEQIIGLYGRKETRVFPPPGLDASDSFFAREDHENPGRLYVGILAPGHGSMQSTQRNVYAALAQEAADLALSANETGGDAAEVADPWWTLLAYYNSLRELGSALTLFGSDIPDQLDVLRKRRGIPSHASRRVWVDGRVLELTSRLDSGEVPGALDSLNRSVREFTEKDGVFTVKARPGPLDACLASNIIEVGVDVPRLSLMAIAGQPKTTAAYIQASSRVGRRADRPGLVVMLYSSTKPRDRSHYERFRAYHQAIYAWVEPTSVTPFSPPVVERALHAVMVAMLRQMAPADATPRQLLARNDLFSHVEDVLQTRSDDVSARPDEQAAALARLGKLRREWDAYSPEEWGKIILQGDLGDNAPLLYPAGRDKPSKWRKAGWATATSLRAVDATCEAGVTTHYADAQAEEADVSSGED